MTEIEQFIENCKSIENVVSVTAHEPSESHLAQIRSAYELDKIPTLFRYNIRDSHGDIQTIQIIVPHELYTTRLPPQGELALAADRCRIFPQENTFFLVPDMVDSIPLLGRELHPVKSPSEGLTKLLSELRSLANIESVNAYNIVDPDLLKQAGDTEAVLIKIDLLGLTKARWNETGDSTDDEINITVIQDHYDNKDCHDTVIAWVQERISEVLSK